jgi:hypothetical protein
VKRSIVYEDLELLFERAGDSYQASVIRSPSGEAPEQVFDVPFSDDALENLVLRMQRSRGKVRGIDTLEPDRVKEFGGDLYEALFRDELRTCFRRSLDAMPRSLKLIMLRRGWRGGSGWWLARRGECWRVRLVS